MKPVKGKKKILIRRLHSVRRKHFMQVTTQRDADRRIGERLGDEVAMILAD